MYFENYSVTSFEYWGLFTLIYFKGLDWRSWGQSAEEDI
jgi:hypothetical protein